MLDYLIVGSGLYGSICAYELNKIGYKCLVLEKRSHIGGNCFTQNRDGIHIHNFGPHIFHTNDKEIWDWINQWANFNSFTLQVVANYKNEIYSLPFSMWTFSKLWNITKPEQAKEIINIQSKNIINPVNLEEMAIKLVGTEVYEKLIRGYTNKQWRQDPKTLPKEIIQRLPVRFTYNNNYFNDSYQGIPIGGYTQIFEKLLTGIEIKFNTDYLLDKEFWNSNAKNIIYTGPIDAFYNYQFGELEYKSTNFVHSRLNCENFQGSAIVNYTDIETPYTRIIEHKHFENIQSNITWITHEYPTRYIAKVTEPYYPVNNFDNNEKYNKYLELSKNDSTIKFGGRLAEYKYYDMHQVIKSALDFIKTINKN